MSSSGNFENVPVTFETKNSGEDHQWQPEGEIDKARDAAQDVQSLPPKLRRKHQEPVRRHGHPSRGKDHSAYHSRCITLEHMLDHVLNELKWVNYRLREQDARRESGDHGHSADVLRPLPAGTNHGLQEIGISQYSKKRKLDHVEDDRHVSEEIFAYTGQEVLIPTPPMAPESPLEVEVQTPAGYDKHPELEKFASTKGKEKENVAGQ